MIPLVLLPTARYKRRGQVPQNGGDADGHGDAFLNESMATLGFLVLSAGWKLTIAVRPVSSLGTKGKAIATTWRRETG